MVLIRDVVQQALFTGYLSVEAEDQLRHLLRAKYAKEDLDAFMSLQQAAMAGIVRQESRELRRLEQNEDRQQDLKNLAIALMLSKLSREAIALWFACKQVEYP